MALPSVHVKDLLVTKGYKFAQVSPQAWDVWIGKQPSLPDRAITIYDSAGLAPNPKWLLDFPGIQIRVRGSQNDYELAYQKAKDVRDILVGVPSYTANDGDRIVMIIGIGDIVHTGWDDKPRPEFVFNVRMTIEPVASPNSNREPL